VLQSLVHRTLRRYAMVAPGERVLVGLSGGPDSVALLAVLQTLAARCRLQLHAAHFNHRWRGAESDRDQACAAAVAARLGVECTIGAAVGCAAGRNREAHARDQRYAFLAAVAAAQGCAKIATGHTLDDQAETVLMRLLRGSGGDGLAGIPAVRDGRIIRPLIACTRAQVVAFLQAAGLPFCEDSSNADRRFLRTRVRHDVLPLLQALNPEVSRHLAAAAGILAEEGGLLDAHVAPLLQAAHGADGALAVAAVRAAPPPLVPRLVRAWLRAQRGGLQRLGAAHVRAVADLICGLRPNAQVCLPGGLVVVREYEHVRLRAGAAVPGTVTAHVLVPGDTVQLESGWCISAALDSTGAGRRLPRDLWSLAADADAIAAPMTVRGARPGDRIRPLGMGGQRKLQDIFVDRKLPHAHRRTRPVVEVGGEVLWVPGVVRSGRALVTPATRSVLRLVAEHAEHPAIAAAKPLC
jgi:tRNA(Ile)-lysidine synthase